MKYTKQILFHEYCDIHNYSPVDSKNHSNGSRCVVFYGKTSVDLTNAFPFTDIEVLITKICA